MDPGAAVGFLGLGRQIKYMVGILVGLSSQLQQAIIHYEYKTSIVGGALIAADFLQSALRLRMRWRMAKQKQKTSYAATTWVRYLVDSIGFRRLLRKGAVLHSGQILHQWSAWGSGPRLFLASRLDENRHVLSCRTSWGS